MCQLCEVACSFTKTKKLSVTSSRIHVPTAFQLTLGGAKPAICRHCEKPPCIDACPVGAITKDPETRLVKVDADLCTGCMECVQVCPFGGASWDPINEEIMICDQCGECVEWCAPGAIKFVEPSQIRERKAIQITESDVQKEAEKWSAMPDVHPHAEMVRTAYTAYFESKEKVKRGKRG